jgi:hypothetical protein
MDYVPQVISEVKGRGLKVDVEYARVGSQYGNGYVYMQLVLTNTKSHTLCNIAMEAPAKLAVGMDVKPFAVISQIAPGSSMFANLHVNFGGKAQTAKFKISFDDGEIVTVPLKPLLGELLVPAALSDAAFVSTQQGLSGLQEASCTVDVAEDADAAQLLASALNAARVVDGAFLLALACSTIYFVRALTLPRSLPALRTPTSPRWHPALQCNDVRFCLDGTLLARARRRRRRRRQVALQLGERDARLRPLLATEEALLSSRSVVRTSS